MDFYHFSRVNLATKIEAKMPSKINAFFGRPPNALGRPDMSSRLGEASILTCPPDGFLTLVVMPFPHHFDLKNASGIPSFFHMIFDCFLGRQNSSKERFEMSLIC